MRAAFYEKNGAARDVLSVAEVETPKPGPGEVRVRLKTSGVNPSDVKGREGRTRKIAFPRVIPHSDGAGGVGHYAIQFAKAAGATVLATISSDAKAALAKQAGADHTIDYKRENVGERVMALTGKAGIDAVIEMDVAANAKLYPGILHARSQEVIYGTGSAEATIPSQFLLTSGIRLQYIFVYELTPAERTSAVTGINRMLENKTLINNVALTLPLKDIVAAHEAVEQGKTMGNVVVTL
jgi:NADPH2:quinone reductase